MTLKFDLIEGHKYIAFTCLAYLRSKELQFDWLGPKRPDKYGLLLTSTGSSSELNSRLQDNELFAYSAQTWAYHLRLCENGNNMELFNLAIDFLLENQNTSDSCLQISQYISNPERVWYWPPGSPLAAAVRTRSSLLVELLLARQRLDIDDTLSTGSTALMEVCSTVLPSDSPSQSEKIFGILLEHGADPLVVDKFGRTALHWAADGGLLRPLEMMLKESIDVNLRDIEGSTPLLLSIFAHKPEATRFLLSHGAMPTSKTGPVIPLFIGP